MRRSGAASFLQALVATCLLLAAVAAEASAAVCPNEDVRDGLSAELPDCRAYEQVSPINKNGNDAGALSGLPQYSLARADGNRIFFGSRGPMGVVKRGVQVFSVGRRGPDGWRTESAFPGGAQELIQMIPYAPRFVVPSDDLSRFLFASNSSFVAANPLSEFASAALYISNADDESIAWLTEPTIADPQPPPGQIGSFGAFQPAGASADLSRVYFTGQPTLVAADAARVAGSWGLYEYTQGQLRSAGTLPDGSLDPRGATPPNTVTGGLREYGARGPVEDAANQVSADGSTMYFLSPDPQAGTPQLYVRRDGSSRLVSHVEPSGAPASSGVSPAPSLAVVESLTSVGQFVYGSPDGRVAYFHSLDALTADAPDDGVRKTYRYDVATDTVSYLADVTGTIVASSDDGERFLFGGSQIGIWDHGTVLPIAPRPGGERLAPARATPSGSAFIFTTEAAIPGFGASGLLQIYRYDLAEGATVCVSCPPEGTPLVGNANLSNAPQGGWLRPSRGIGDDARRIFFDSAAQLVPRDTNGRRDVYEWTDGGGAALISSGTGERDSFFLDNSASGDDVFFTTAQGLLPGDVDEAYDVYDARVGGGFPTQARPDCAGEGCLGPPTPTPTLAAPASDRLRGHRRPHRSGRLRIEARRLTGTVLKLTVAVPDAGRLGASGRGLRARGHVCHRRGFCRLAVPLRSGPRRALREGREVVLAVELRFVPRANAGRPRSLHLEVAGGNG